MAYELQKKTVAIQLQEQEIQRREREMTEDVVKVIAQVPPVIESLTGLKLDQLIERVRGPQQDGGTSLPGPKS